MAVKLRLRRMGRKKLPVYAVVAADARSPRDGRFIEDLGRYYPLTEPAEVELKQERILYWLQQGAQPTDTVRNLLSRKGILLAFHMQRKGKSIEEIDEAITAHLALHTQKAGVNVKVTSAERRRQALDAEKKQVAEQEEKEAQLRAEAEAKAKAEAEKARKKAAAEAEKARQEAAAQAKAEQEAANVAQETEDAKAPDAPEKEETTEKPAKPEASAKSAKAAKSDTPSEKK